MLRLVGAILVLVGSTGFAIGLCRELKEGLINLRYVIGILDAFLSEIGFRRLPLSECCNSISKELMEPYGQILKGIYFAYEREGEGKFGDCWKREMEKGLSKVTLTKEEREIVIRLFDGEVAYDMERQINILESKKRMLEKNLRVREQEFAEKKRIYTTLGVMAGFLLVLILI